MDGDVMEAALEATVTSHSDASFHYVEIGVASGATLAAMALLLEGCGIRYRCDGVDIANGWSYDKEEAKRRMWANPFPYHWQLWDCGSFIFLKRYVDAIDFLLIDGCHCFECCFRDFVMAEPLIRVGGMVAFHDVDVENQCKSEELQHWGEKLIEVRRAVQELGLLDGSRPGWEVWKETGYNWQTAARGMLFVRKVSE
mgnify:FL=1